MSELADASRNGSQYATNTDTALNKKNAEDVARMVFTFVAGAKAFTEGMDESDDIKLLRMRTRKNEIVIVPGEHCHSNPILSIDSSIKIPNSCLSLFTMHPQLRRVCFVSSCKDC